MRSLGRHTNSVVVPDFIVKAKWTNPVDWNGQKMWWDSTTGVLRYKASKPSSETDGERLLPGDIALAEMNLPSTTYTTIDGKKGIKYDLLDEGQMWNYSDFRARSLSTSWYAELGHMPTQGLIILNHAQTAITIYDLQTMTAWMTFTGHANGMVYGSGGIINDIDFLDGILYVCAAGAPAQRVDFVKDWAGSFSTADLYVYDGKISERNDGNGYTKSASIGVIHATGYAISVIRDSLGSVDDIGRPRPVVWITTLAANNVSTPGLTAWYDDTFGGFSGAPAVSGDVEGGFFYPWVHSTNDYAYWRSPDENGAAHQALGSFWNGEAGASDLPWANGAVFSAAGIIPNLSVNEFKSPVLLLGCDEGLMLSHAQKVADHNGLTFIIDEVANWPPYSGSGNKKRSWALDSIAELFGNDLTNGSSVSFATDGITGKCATFTAASSMYLYENDSADHTFTTAFSCAAWIKRASDTGATEGIMGKMDSGVGADRAFSLSVAVNDTLNGAVFTDSGGYLHISVGTSAIISVGKWHHCVLTYDGITGRIYLDGILVGETAGVGNMQDSAEPLIIGNSQSAAGVPAAGGFFDGNIDQALVMDRTLSDKEIALLYTRGQVMLLLGTSQVLTNADVDYIQVSPEGSYAIIGDEAYAYVIDPRLGVILETIASPGGNIQDAAVWETIDGYDYSLFCSTTIKVKQTDPSVFEAMRR